MSLFTIGASTWITWENIRASELQCANWSSHEYNKVEDRKGQDVWALAFSMGCVLLVSYIAMLFYRLNQSKQWKAELLVATQMSLDKVSIDNKAKILETKKNAVRHVFGFYVTYMGASLIGLTGIALCFIADRNNKQFVDSI